jgi:hypothetical protein
MKVKDPNKHFDVLPKKMNMWPTGKYKSKLQRGIISHPYDGYYPKDKRTLVRMKRKGSTPVGHLVAHDCNPSYSGGRDSEGQGSKPAWANSSTSI